MIKIIDNIFYFNGNKIGSSQRAYKKYIKTDIILNKINNNFIKEGFNNFLEKEIIENKFFITQNSIFNSFIVALRLYYRDSIYNREIYENSLHTLSKELGIEQQYINGLSQLIKKSNGQEIEIRSKENIFFNILIGN